jgi:hypothetical protein
MALENNTRMQRIINYRQVTIGTIFLVLGLFFYMLDRNFIPILAIPAEQYININFGNLGWFSGFLPSFIHPIAFCILCAAIFQPSTKISSIICSSWAVLHIFLEIGQAKPAYSLLSNIFCTMGRNNMAFRYVEEYFKVGVFDIMDLLSAVIGSFIAFYLITLTQHHSDNRSFAYGKGGSK